MALHCLILLGPKNEPLYSCSTTAPSINKSSSSLLGDDSDDDEFHDQQQDNQNLGGDDTNSNKHIDSNDDDDDIFGFLQQQQDAAGSGSGSSNKQHHCLLPIRHEMMIHSSLDRLEEMLGSPKKASISIGRFQRGSHWLGCICPMEEFEVYGYVSSSDVKFLALVERGDVITVKKRKEIDIKMLLTAVHDAYVKHTMNPFTRIRGKIESPCTDFESGVQIAVDAYKKTLLKT
mmetsp:Transcript_47618/g.116002  ORF Transcript_47618/g.116002 Transcript_47618/m.116002 type:complete len:232 (+) Transcript_47618:122-817(+)